MSEFSTQSLESFRQMHINKKLFEIDILSIDMEEKYVGKQILAVKNLDLCIRKMSDKVKKAKQETLICQCENRKRLTNILSSSPFKIGKLAENTRQFFHLCPRYMMLSAEFHNDNESNISLEINDSKQQAFRNEDNTNLVSDINALIDYSLQSTKDIEIGQWKVMNLINDVEYVNNKMLDHDRNPYVVDEEAKKILLELDKKVSVYHKDFFNDYGQLKKAHDNTSTNTVISTLDSVSTIQSLHDIDKDLLDEVIKEAGIIDPLSILKIAEDNIDT